MAPNMPTGINRFISLLQSGRSIGTPHRAARLISLCAASAMRVRCAGHCNRELAEKTHRQTRRWVVSAMRIFTRSLIAVRNVRVLGLATGRHRNAGRQPGIDQPSDICTGVFAKHQPVLHQVVDSIDDRAAVLTERFVALLDGRPWIAGRESIGPGLRERDILPRTFATVVGPHPRAKRPTRVRGERYRNFREPDAGDVVAVAVDLRYEARVDRTELRVVLHDAVEPRRNRRVDRRNERAIEIRAVVEAIARRL